MTPEEQKKSDEVQKSGMITYATAHTGEPTEDIDEALKFIGCCGGDFCDGDHNDTLKSFIRQQIVRELEWLLKNASGGGDWRRIAEQRIKSLSKE